MKQTFQRHFPRLSFVNFQTMLEDLVNGKEKSRFILVHDTVQHRGNCILKYITQEFLNRFDAVVAFIFDEHPTNFKLNLNDTHRLHCHDAFSDPLNWNENKCLSSASVTTPFYLKGALAKIIESDDQCFKKTLAGPLKLGVIINSLSSLLNHQEIALVCRDVFEVMQWKTQACEVLQTVALVHCDLHSENILSSLNHVASTTIELEQKTNHIKDGSDTVCYLNITHCKKTGKIQRKKEGYRIVQDSQITIIPFNKEDQRQSKLPGENPDVTSNLTFNLTLTDQQKKARANLQLPYLLNEKIKQTQLDLGSKSQIFYEADEADDMDEEDPDDDLNI